MRLGLVLLLLSIALSSVRAQAPQSPEPALALNGLDPISLVAGKEIAGQKEIETTFGRFRYRFASEDQRAVFLKDPTAHCIQFGGACGKMGPFTGQGAADRYWVHDQRIYLFASEGCREAFKQAPAAHIELPNPPPAGNAAERKRGTELIELALRGFGGQERVDELKTFESHEVQIYRQGGKEFRYPHRVKARFPLDVRVEDDFGSLYGYIVAGDKAIEFEKDQRWPLDDTVRDVARRRVLRYPLVMLKNRTREAFIAVAGGTGKAGDAEIEKLQVALYGATSTWSIEPATGRVVEVAYLARQGKNGDNLVRYGDFRAVDGLMLPHTRRVFFNGQEVKSPEIRWEKFALNERLDDSQFLMQEKPQP